MLEGTYSSLDWHLLLNCVRTTGKDLQWLLENGVGTERARYRHDNQVIWVDFCENHSFLIVEWKRGRLHEIGKDWNCVLNICNRLCTAGQMRAAGGSVDSIGLWRKGGRRSMAIWQWLTKGLITTPTTTTPPSNCTTLRYTDGSLREYMGRFFKQQQYSVCQWTTQGKYMHSQVKDRSIDG